VQQQQQEAYKKFNPLLAANAKPNAGRDTLTPARTASSVRYNISEVVCIILARLYALCCITLRDPTGSVCMGIVVRLSAHVICLCR
jgi:hypothetical protein